MGNSSSGIKEATFFNCPAINIGDRQKSRLKPKNVIDVKANKKIIIKIVNELKNYKVFDNPYKLDKKIEQTPVEIKKKFSRNNLKFKKCTI